MVASWTCAALIVSIAGVTLAVELCDRTITELLLSDANFLSVVGVLGYNPGLIKEMDFRSDLEAGVGYKEVCVCVCVS